MSYDEFDAPHWNLVQTLAWIYLGDRQLVRRAAEAVQGKPVVTELMFWQELRLPDGRKELVETPAGRPGPITLEVTASMKGGAAYSTFSDAENALLTALRTGLLRALGLRNNRGDLEEIRAELWEELKFEYDDRGDKHCAGPIDPFRPSATRWYRLKFKRAEILALWPDPFRGADLEADVVEGSIPDYDPLPDQTIGLPEAVWRVWERLYPSDSKSLIRFSREVWAPEGPREVPCNEIALEYQRETSANHGEAKDRLADALASGVLRAKFITSDGSWFVVPAAYWKTGAARSFTISTGRLEPAGDAFEILNRYRLTPCFVDRAEYEAWLVGAFSKTTGPKIDVAHGDSSISEGPPVFSEQPDAVSDDWLNRETLELAAFINLAAELPPIGWPPPEPWIRRFREIKAAIDLGELSAVARGAVANKSSLIRLSDVWSFAANRRADWDWLREFCQRWAARRDEVLPKVLPTRPLSAAKTSSPRSFSEATLTKWYKEYVKSFDRDSRPPTREDDLAAARRKVSKGVPRDAVREARRKFAPPQWKSQGRRRMRGETGDK